MRRSMQRAELFAVRVKVKDRACDRGDHSSYHNPPVCVDSLVVHATVHVPRCLLVIAIVVSQHVVNVFVVHVLAVGLIIIHKKDE